MTSARSPGCTSHLDVTQRSPPYNYVTRRDSSRRELVARLERQLCTGYKRADWLAFKNNKITESVVSVDIGVTRAAIVNKLINKVCKYLSTIKCKLGQKLVLFWNADCTNAAEACNKAKLVSF